MSRNIFRDSLPEGMFFAAGEQPGCYYDTKFGRNADVDGPEDITSMGGDYAGHPISGGSALGVEENIELVFADANDTAAGTGAQEITITLLDEYGKLQTEVIATDGSSGLDTGLPAIRSWRGEVTKSGSNGGAAGLITARHVTTTANVFWTIAAGADQSEVAVLTVPVGYKCVLSEALLKPKRGGNFDLDGAFRIRKEGMQGYVRKNILRESNTTTPQPDPGMLRLPALADIKLRIEEVSTTNIDIAGQFNYLLIPD